MDPAKLPVHALNDHHRHLLIRAISRVLVTDIAETTFAQILDGLPTAEVGDDCSDGELPDGHPLREKHRQLCPGHGTPVSRLIPARNLGNGRRTSTLLSNFAARLSSI